MKGLKAIRKDRGFSQLQLAEYLHISPSAVAMWELGKKNACLGQVLSLCRILGCTPADLFMTSGDSSCRNDSSVPVFYGSRLAYTHFSPCTCYSPLSECQFGVAVPYDLSGRICQGDICYFELTDRYRSGDVVISLDRNSTQQLFIADSVSSPESPIVAVCRFMQRRL